jgi:hypothetical protein
MNRHTTPHRMHPLAGNAPEGDSTESLLIGLRALIDAGCDPEEILARIGQILRTMAGDTRYEALRQFVAEGQRQKPQIVAWYFDREALTLHPLASMVRVNLTKRRVLLWGAQRPIIVDSEELYHSATQAGEELAHELRLKGGHKKAHKSQDPNV